MFFLVKGFLKLLKFQIFDFEALKRILKFLGQLVNDFLCLLRGQLSLLINLSIGEVKIGIF